MKKNITILVLTLAVIAANFAEIKAQIGGIGLDPTRMEVVIPAGTEKTVGAVVDYRTDEPGRSTGLARLIARLEDWTVSPEGDVKIAMPGTLERSAFKWVTMSTTELTLAPDTQKTLRFTISVPKGTPPGDYLFAAYVENRDAPPPPKENHKQVVISFRHYLLVYVMVPDLTVKGELEGLDIKVENGRPVAMPVLSNSGNSRLRPSHSFEISDADGKKVFASDPSEARVVLGGHKWQIPYRIDADLGAGKYTLQYTVDFGDKKAIQVGKTTFEITEADVAARRKFDEQRLAELVKEEEKKPAEDKPVSVDGEKKAEPSAQDKIAADLKDQKRN